MLIDSKALLWMSSKPGTPVHVPGKSNDASRASVLPSLLSDCRYSRDPVPALASRDARRCLLPQRGRRLLCRQYSAPCRRWVSAGGLSGGGCTARLFPGSELGGAASQDCSAAAGRILCASLRPAGVTVVPREERELRLVSPVGVSRVVHIRLLALFKQKTCRTKPELHTQTDLEERTVSPGFLSLL